MKKDNTFYKEYIAPIVVLVGICLVMSFLLAYVNSVTSPIIQANAASAADGARAVVLPGGENFTDITDTLTLVNGVTSVYEAGNGKGITVTVAKKGFGGDVELMIGVDSEGQVAGMSVLNHAETPGLGTNALTDEYFANYLGLTQVKSSDGTVDGTEVAVFSGASYTSRAVMDDVAAALTQYAVYGGASYEAPVEKTVDELKAEAVELYAPGAELVEGAELAENAYEVYVNADGQMAVFTKTKGYHAQEDETATINAIVGVSKDGTVTGISVVEHQETPGVGTTAMTDDYFAQFIGAGNVTLKSTAEEGQTKIEVVSGATYTAKGIYYAAKAALAQYALM